MFLLFVGFEFSDILELQFSERNIFVVKKESIKQLFVKDDKHWARRF
jgi:hypothetical protein